MGSSEYDVWPVPGEFSADRNDGSIWQPAAIDASKTDEKRPATPPKEGVELELDPAQLAHWQRVIVTRARS